MLRRVADHLFWGSRYLERTQWRARLVDVNYHLILEVPPRDTDPWEPLLGITAEREVFAIMQAALIWHFAWQGTCQARLAGRKDRLA